MTAATVDLTETIILNALRGVLQAQLPTGIEVIRAQVNRVAEPLGVDFVVLTPILRKRLAFNITGWSDGLVPTPHGPGIATNMVPTEVTVQLDIHGPASAENVQIIHTLMRSDVVFAAFAATGLAVQTLYAEDPRQSPFHNDSQQVEDRWTMDVVLQANIVVTTPQDFAASLDATLISVDAVYPP